MTDRELHEKSLAMIEKLVGWIERRHMGAATPDEKVLISALRSRLAQPEAREPLSEEERRHVERYKFLRGDGGPESVRWPRWKIEHWFGGYWGPIQGEELDVEVDRAIERKVRGE